MTEIVINFDELRDKIWNYILTSYQKDKKFPYPLQSGGNGDIYGTCFAVYIADMLDRMDKFPGREQICNELNELSSSAVDFIENPEISPTTLIPSAQHDKYYIDFQTTYFVNFAVKLLGCGEIHFPKSIEQLISCKNNIYDYLDSLNWENPWLVSNIDMFLGCLLLYDNSRGNDMIDRSAPIRNYFDWHNDNIDKNSGTWGKQSDAFNAMAGAYHILLHYDYHKESFDYGKQLIDTVLKLPWDDGLFTYGGGGGSCEDMDAIDILVRLSLKTDHKKREVDHILISAASR